MNKKRLYNKENKAVGTLHVDENRELIGLQFPRESRLKANFLLNVNNFLKKNKLKPVSPAASFRKHHNNKEYNISMNGIDIYYKTKNPRTQKIEIKPIGSQSHGYKSKEISPIDKPKTIGSQNTGSGKQ